MDQTINIAQDALRDPPAEVQEAIDGAPSDARSHVSQLQSQLASQVQHSHSALQSGSLQASSIGASMDAKLQVGELWCVTHALVISASRPSTQHQQSTAASPISSHHSQPPSDGPSAHSTGDLWQRMKQIVESIKACILWIWRIAKPPH